MSTKEERSQIDNLTFPVKILVGGGAWDKWNQSKQKAKVTKIKTEM